MAGSFLYLYLPMIPDMAILRDHGTHFPKWRQRLYRILSLGWQNTPDQHHRLERGISVMAIIIIPVAISIHTVTSWIFGMTLRPGWHSTIIGPDFVIGALYSGIAAVITAIAAFRHFFHLEHFLTPKHIRKLGTLLMIFCLAYIYFMINEYIGPGYSKETHERALLFTTMRGTYSLLFWMMFGLGLIVPLILLVNPWRSMRGVVLASLLANVGMWLKRYIIVVPTLSTTYLPKWNEQLATYIPTWVELSITLGAVAAFLLLYTMFAKVFPIVSIWEVVESHRKYMPAKREGAHV